MRQQPPKFALRFFRWFCHDNLVSSIEGDLTELYGERIRTIGKRKADLRFILDVMLLFRPGIIRSFRSQYPSNNYTMFKNYFLVAWRSMMRQKMYSFIKIGGFAVGIAACMLIGLFILDEISYDRDYADGDRIYRVLGVITQDGEVYKDVWMQPPFADAFKNEFPEVEQIARLNPVILFGAGENEVRRADKDESYHDEGFTYADPEFLTLFSLPMVEGSREKALSQPNSIVITRSRAEKYFPNESALGKTLILNNDPKREYTVGGVIEDFPTNSHLQYKFLITLQDKEFYPGEQGRWDTSNYPTYVKLREGADPEGLAERMISIMERYILPLLKESGIPDLESLMETAHFELQPVSDIHLFSQDVSDGLSHGSIRTVWLFGSVALFILLIACFNFINLSTARSANRAREVGIRKVVGSVRNNIVSQFLSESLLYSLISFAIGIAIVQLTLPLFSDLTGKSISMPWSAWWLAPGVLTASLLVGFFSGLYPSFYLSSFRPLQVLKGNLALGTRTSSARSVLVVFQFTISIVLIISTMVIVRQMEFIMNKDLGFTKERVVLVHGTKMLGDQLQPFKEELKNIAGVQSVAIGDYLPISGTTRNGNGFAKEGVTDAGVGGQKWVVDNDYVQTMDMQLVAGRGFNPDLETDNQSAIINEKMVHDLALTNPIGARIVNGSSIWTVIGVVKDFNFESLRSEIKPVCLVRGISNGIVSIRLSSDDPSQSLKGIEAVWKKFVPNQVIRYSFMDDAYIHMYDDVNRTKRIFMSFAVLGILVACLGLFGLSAFMAEQRRKEISIRKVLGASTEGIVQMLTKNFVKLVLVSFVIAAPLAWWLMTKWLQDYAYKTDLTWEPFAAAGIVALAVAVLTVGYQALKASVVNPVVNLKAD